MMTDTWTWATVTQATPLRIKVDGDTSALDATTDNLVGSLAVFDRVRVHLHSDGIIVTGLQGGQTRFANPLLFSWVGAAEASESVLKTDVGAEVRRNLHRNPRALTTVTDGNRHVAISSGDTEAPNYTWGGRNDWLFLARGTGIGTFRTSVLEASLIDGDAYTVSALVANPNATAITFNMDWCDNGVTAFTLAPGESRRIAMTASRADYTSMYRFADLEAPGDGSAVLITEVLIEQGGLRPYFDAATQDQNPVTVGYLNERATANPAPYTLMERNTRGTAKVATPTETGDIANKGYADALGYVGTWAGTIMRRDENARAKVADPAVDDDIANRGWVEARKWVGDAQSVNGVDMNTVKTSGNYFGYSQTNSAYNSISTFLVLAYSPNWVIQIQFAIKSDGQPENAVYMRSYHTGTTWSAWALLAL